VERKKRKVRLRASNTFTHFGKKGKGATYGPRKKGEHTDSFSKKPHLGKRRKGEKNTSNRGNISTKREANEEEREQHFLLRGREENKEKGGKRGPAREPDTSIYLLRPKEGRGEGFTPPPNHHMKRREGEE